MKKHKTKGPVSKSQAPMVSKASQVDEIKEITMALKI
jgi:hypothetical protein